MDHFAKIFGKRGGLSSCDSLKHPLCILDRYLVRGEGAVWPYLGYFGSVFAAPEYVSKNC